MSFIKKQAGKLQSSLQTLPGDLKDHHQRSSGPSSYKPAGPDSGAPIHTKEGLAANSAILKQQNAIHRPPPPPRRGMDPGSAPPTRSTSVSSGRESVMSATTSPTLASATRGTPAPPYGHARNNDVPGGRKLFSQYDQEDKEDFFNSLDEVSLLRLVGETKFECYDIDSGFLPQQYFSSRLSLSANAPVSSAPLPSATTRPSLPSTRSSTAPPPAHSFASPILFSPTYPPPQSHSCSALSTLHFILYAHYSTPWFLSSPPIPPPLTTRSDMRWSGSWSSLGDSKSLIGFALFGDGSVAWWKLSWSAREESSGRLDLERGVKKEGRYRPVPEAWSGEKLFEASEKYGSGMVRFVEEAVRSRRPVARGECWDVAAEALSSFKSEPKPFPSIGRTHGHLMFWAQAGKMGRWRGGEQYVRAGDVVEWNRVKIREVGMARGGWSTLGDPEHTAVIVAAGTPTTLPQDGQEYPIEALVSLTVVEQSQGAVPVERTYDMTAMSEGQIWIYRPVPLVEYVGTEIGAEWPPNCQTWEVGQLE
ncbi:hypothetical protein P7C70_g4263, partial [Phenoliferia sp. Uapishka_3]